MEINLMKSLQEDVLEEIHHFIVTGKIPVFIPHATILDSIERNGLVLESDYMHQFRCIVQTQIHLILTVSPNGSTFRDACKMYPGFT